MPLNFSKQHSKYTRSSRCPHCNKLLLYTRDYVDGRAVSPWRFGPPKDPSTIQECPKCSGRWSVYGTPMKIEVEEGNRESEVAYQEEIVLDNLRGKSLLKRKKTISEEWTQTLDLGSERSATQESSLRLGNDTIGITEMAQNALKTTYRLSQGQTKTYSEELDFEVPAGVRRRVTLIFKRVWQYGRLRFEDDGRSMEIPFKVVVGLELDVTQDDRRQ